MVEREMHWLRTVGGPRAGDPRDGELHQIIGTLPDHFHLESWEDDRDGADALYVRAPEEPVEEGGRLVWKYVFQSNDPGEAHDERQ